MTAERHIQLRPAFPGTPGGADARGTPTRSTAQR
jgi:hypothetical protein